MTVPDPRVVERAGTLTAPSEDSAVRTIGRGLETAPILRQGLGLTWLLAAIGAGGRVVVPILIQQAIDRGIVGEDDVRVDLIVQMAMVAVLAVLISGVDLRQAALKYRDRRLARLRRLREQASGSD